MAGTCLNIYRTEKHLALYFALSWAYNLLGYFSLKKWNTGRDVPLALLFRSAFGYVKNKDYQRNQPPSDEFSPRLLALFYHYRYLKRLYLKKVGFEW